MTQPANPHPQAQQTVTLTVTQEQLYVLHSGVESMADTEDGEFAYIREVAGNLALPKTVVEYKHMSV